MNIEEIKLQSDEDRIEELEDVIVILLSALLNVEWVETVDDDVVVTECPWCHGYSMFKGDNGHEPDCNRQAAIAAAYE